MDYTVKRDHWKAIVAETRIDLGFDRRELRISTSKRSQGGLMTLASVVQMSEDGHSYSHMFGLGKPGSGDWSRRLAVEAGVRATEKAVRAQHEKALADIDVVIAEAKAYYAEAPA